MEHIKRERAQEDSSGPPSAPAWMERIQKFPLFIEKLFTELSLCVRPCCKHWRYMVTKQRSSLWRNKAGECVGKIGTQI